LPAIAGKEGILFCMNCTWHSVVNISSCQLAAGFLLSSAMSSSFFPSSGGIIDEFSCGMATGFTAGFLCGIADGLTDGFWLELLLVFVHLGEVCPPS
jgi:hypothetical protein